MIFVSPGRRSLADFRRFWACQRLPGTFPLSSAQFDEGQFPALPFPLMGRGKIGALNAQSASPEEK
jgi:hypothetical protein